MDEIIPPTEKKGQTWENRRLNVPAVYIMPPNCDLASMFLVLNVQRNSRMDHGPGMVFSS